MRTRAVDAFRRAETPLLVATGAAARGLDFPALRHVILAGVSTDAATFVHAAGRTARRGQPGLVTCLVPSEHTEMTAHQEHHALRPAAKLRFARERPGTT